MRSTSPNLSLSGSRCCRTFQPPHLLSEAFREYLSGNKAEDLSQLQSRFPTAWRIYVMGGALRNLLLQRVRGLLLKNRDLDLVIDGADSADELHAAVKDYCLQRNDFGGVKCRVRPDGVVFDIWRIEDHVNMSLSESPPSIKELLKHNLVDVDAVVLDLQTGVLHDGGCLAAIERGVIDLMGPEGISRQFPAAQVAHIILIASKTRFELSNECRLFVNGHLNDPVIRKQVMAIVSRKLQTNSVHAEQLLNSLAQEEPWPTMAT